MNIHLYTNVIKKVFCYLLYPPLPVTLTFDLLTLKVVSESRVTWATAVPSLVLAFELEV